MGTRNLTIVKLDGEYKVAQYGQWDGYPGGQGFECLTFLRIVMNPEKFKAAVRNCRFTTKDELQSIWKQYGATEKGWIKSEDAARMESDYPQFVGGCGAKILELIQKHPEGMLLQDQIAFAADSLMCEWAWVIDFDAGTFEGYTGFNKEPLTENDRFCFLRDLEEGEYHGVKLAATFPLDALPDKDTFLAAFYGPEDTEQAKE